MRRPKTPPMNIGFTLVEIMCVVMVIAIIMAMAIPNFLHAREASRSRACTQNLRQFQTAKDQWAIVTRAGAAATPERSELVTEFMKGTEDTLPECPAGGDYSLNSLRDPPACTVGTNGTAETWDDHLVK